jgi:hypothetical protein
MASFIYNSAIEDIASGAIGFGADSLKAMLVTSGYVANKDTHLRRSDVTNEVVGPGYIEGGRALDVSITKDTVTDRVVIEFLGVAWNNSSITARGCVYYKSRGSASADELVAYNDFGFDASSSLSSLIVNSSTITLQN